MEIVIKIGRDTVTFTEEDVFVDNGSCVQCKTKIGKHIGYGRYSILSLTQKALKELESMCVRIPVKMEEHPWNQGVQYFHYKEK